MMKTLIAVWLAVVAVGAAPPRAAAQGGPTSSDDMAQPFDPRYLLGVWEVEWTPPDDVGPFPPGPLTGIERVTHIDSRFLKVEVYLQGRDGTTISGEGMIFYEYGLGGQHLVRYVVYDAGFALLQTGPVGGRPRRLLQRVLGDAPRSSTTPRPTRCGAGRNLSSRPRATASTRRSRSTARHTRTSA